MDSGTVAKKSIDPVYFVNDSILEAAKFLNYERWSRMRFVCRRINQLIDSNQSRLQAFEVTSLSVEKIACRSNSIVSFDQTIQSADAVRKWIQDHSYLCDETTDMPLEKVFAGMTHFDPIHILHFTVRAFFKESRKNILRSPELFSAKFNAKYEFCGTILSHFFRLLHHPAAYFREISMFPPMTDKFCDERSKNLIRCEKFTLHHLDSSLEHSLKWLKENVRAQQLILSFNYNHPMPSSDLYRLVSEFILLDASICAKDCITLDGLRHPGKFISTLIKKYGTLEAKKTIPSILIEDCPSKIYQCLESNLVPQDDLPLYDIRGEKCYLKTYELQNKLDENRKMIAQFRRCVKRGCSHYGSIFRMRFE